MLHPHVEKQSGEGAEGCDGIFKEPIVHLISKRQVVRAIEPCRDLGRGEESFGHPARSTFLDCGPAPDVSTGCHIGSPAGTLGCTPQ